MRNDPRCDEAAPVSLLCTCSVPPAAPSSPHITGGDVGRARYEMSSIFDLKVPDLGLSYSTRL